MSVTAAELLDRLAAVDGLRFLVAQVREQQPDEEALREVWGRLWPVALTWYAEGRADCVSAVFALAEATYRDGPGDAWTDVADGFWPRPGERTPADDALVAVLPDVLRELAQRASAWHAEVAAAERLSAEAEERRLDQEAGARARGRRLLPWRR